MAYNGSGIYEIPLYQTLDLVQTLIGYFVYTLLANRKIMVNYEITFKQRGIETIEYLAARNILDAIAEFYKIHGWYEILKIERTE